ncbi:MAG: hypothetical protein K2O02_06440 [Lachnospiraceae bacterium]|nr:hypothetical protein [Lachnospiraceae bacterium]
MNINAASLADILKLNGVFSNEGRDGKKESGIRKAGGTETAGAGYTKGTGYSAGIGSENYTKRDCISAEEMERNSGQQTVSAFEQVKEGINTFVNNVSADSYEEFEKMGIIPDQEEPESFLTVAERIEIQLAAHSKDYVPNGSIDIDDIRAVYGETGRTYEIANALKEQGLNITAENIAQIESGLEMAEELGEITPEMSAYLLKNNLPVSIENVYKAKYSGADAGSGYHSNTIGDEDWKQLSEQITEKLETVGIPADQRNMQDARWMLENHIPVTAANILKMQEIHGMNEMNSGAGLEGITESQWISGLAAGFALGMGNGSIPAGTAVSATDGEVSDSTIIRQASEAVEIFENGTDEQIEQIVSQGKEVTLLNMKKVQQETVSAGNEQRHQQEQKNQQRAYVEKQYLIEIKLTMSVSGFALLLKNGFDLQIASLQEIAVELREQQDIYADAMLYSAGTDMELQEQEMESVLVSGNRELFWSSIGYMREFSYTSAYVLGNVAAGAIAFEVQEICIEGAKPEYGTKSVMTEAAVSAYETMGTRPRGDLGDSIQKAFAGIDDILRDLNMEENPVNQRAARILAYNEMEITRENLLTVKELDMEVSRLIDNMTPKTTAYLIANGINPLKTDIRKLNDKLDEINTRIEADTGENFSRFLWKLDKKKEITPEDRKTYIGIYRALHTIQRADRRAIGELVKEGGTLTIQSLLTAARSIGKHMDAAVDDETGLTEQRILPENNLDVQLEQMAGYEDIETADDVEERYMETLVNKGMDMISPQALMHTVAESGTEQSLEQFVTQMMWYADSEEQADEEVMKTYYEEIIKEDAEARFVSEKAISSLMDNGISPSISNLLAASGLMTANGKGLMKLLGADGEKEQDWQDETEEMLLNGMEGEEAFSQAYDKMIKQASEYTTQSAYEGKLDVAELRGRTRQITFIRKSASQKSYYIPSKIGRESTTIHLTLKTGRDEKGKVEIEMETERFGFIRGELSVYKMSVSMSVQTDSRELTERLERNSRIFEEEIHILGMTVSDSVDEKTENFENEDSKEENGISTDRLYQLAKKFIHFVKVTGND